jgi:predicted dinucleotide-binding enzyme
MSEKRPSTWGRIASRSKAPALIRMKLLFAAETQKWFAGKVVVDCTNPLKEDFSGLALGYTTSGAEQVAEWATGAKVFKGFTLQEEAKS